MNNKANNTKKIPIVCFKYLNDEKSLIEIYRIFDSADDAREEGFAVSKTTVNSLGNSGGYNWMNLSMVEELYSDCLKDFLNKQELPELEIFNKTHLDKYTEFKSLPSLSELKQGSLSIVCHDKDFNIKKIYKNLEEIKVDGFSITKVCKELKRENKFHGGYYWEYLDNWTKNEKLDEYYNKQDLEVITKIPSSISKIRIVQVKADNNEFVSIYPSLHDITVVSYKSISKVLQKDLGDREYKGYKWYRVSEYVELFPDKVKDIDNAHALVEGESSPAELRILLTIPEKLVSVNDLYKAKIAYKAGRPYPVLYKNPKAVQNGNVIKDQLRALDLKKYIPWLNKTKKYEILMNFILKSGVYRRDTANLDKEIIDDITRYIKDDLGIEHFDDSEIFECSFSKSICPGAKKEMVCFILRESFVEERIDVIDKPKRVYLSGSYFPQYSWRTEVESILSGKVECFNPESSLWDAEKRNIERFRRCDTDLYIVTPGELSEELLHDIITRLTSKPSSNFVYVGIHGDLSDYSPEELNRIDLLEKIIKPGNGSRAYFRYLKEITDIINWFK